MILIKRYSNRKLYSTKTSSYVTLLQVFELSKNNEILVIDNKTKADLTRYTLLLGEAESLRQSGVPLVTQQIYDDIRKSIRLNLEKQEKA